MRNAKSIQSVFIPHSEFQVTHSDMSGTSDSSDERDNRPVCIGAWIECPGAFASGKTFCCNWWPDYLPYFTGTPVIYQLWLSKGESVYARHWRSSSRRCIDEKTPIDLGSERTGWFTDSGWRCSGMPQEEVHLCSGPNL